MEFLFNEKKKTKATTIPSTSLIVQWQVYTE